MGEAPFLKVSCATTTPEAPFLRSVGEGKIFLKGTGAPKLAERHKETSVRSREPLGTPAPESVCLRIFFIFRPRMRTVYKRGENRKTSHKTHSDSQNFLRLRRARRHGFLLGKSENARHFS